MGNYIPLTLFRRFYKMGYENLVAGEIWGQYRLPDGTVVSVKDTSEQIYYDSDMIAAAPGATDYVLFRNANFSTGALKTIGIDYNVPEWGRVPLDWYYSIICLGFHAQAGIPNFDLQALVNRAYMRFISGSQKVEADGLLMYYPFGVGIGGSIALDGGVVANEASFGNIGTPASASVLPKKYNINLPGQTTYEIHVTFPGAGAAAIFSAPLQLYADLRVIRYRPVV
jgi:hypothetical protein